MKDSTGPKKRSPIHPDRLRFGAVRVSARLRREAIPPARQLADEIDAALAALPHQVDEAGRVPLCAGLAQIGSRTVRVTPDLMRALREMSLLLTLDRMIRERLDADPHLAALKALLDEGG